MNSAWSLCANSLRQCYAIIHNQSLECNHLTILPLVENLNNPIDLIGGISAMNVGPYDVASYACLQYYKKNY
jgi:hypothetical protein